MSFQAERRWSTESPSTWTVAVGAAIGLGTIVSALPLLALGEKTPVEVRRTFEITASRYTFDPDRIEVRQGEHVRLVLRSVDTTHGLAIEGYGVDVAIPRGGQGVSVEFIAHRPGTFRMACSEYCGSGHGEMQGWLVVKGAGE